MPDYSGVRVYAIGKIEQNGWRNSLFPIRRSPDDWEYPEAEPWPSDTPIRELPGAVYVGPHFYSDDHGCYHRGSNSHGVAAGSSACGGVYPGLTRPEVVKRCLAAIEDSTHIFGWIDDPSAYGSLVELGYARALNKHTSLYFSSEAKLSDLWFSTQICSSFSEMSDYRSAWDDFCARIAPRASTDMFGL